jgi:hypothetical protein
MRRIGRGPKNNVAKSMQYFAIGMRNPVSKNGSYDMREDRIKTL